MMQFGGSMELSMTKLLEKAITELRRLPASDQDEVAAHVLELIAATDLVPSVKATAIGRSKDILRYGTPDANLDNILTVDDVHAWASSTIDGR
jgi:hypothetical protein